MLTLFRKPPVCRPLMLACRLLFAVCPAAGAAAPQSESVKHGKELYERFGCYQCHGHLGQGGANGPPLVLNVYPVEAYQALVRQPHGNMPPYRTEVLSDEQLGLIHSYIKAIDKGPAVDEVPLLRTRKRH